MKLIKVKNLSVSYDGDIVLENVNLQIDKGDMIAFVGPNGAGKSTLIKSIMNLINPLVGEIKINGKSYLDMRKKIAYIPQRKSVDWDFPINVFEVVEMGTYSRVGFLKKVSKLEKEKVLEALKKVDMLEFKNRQISELSGGQQQRIFLARSLVQEADIYILDEPFQGIDIKTEKSIIEILKKLKDEGKTIIVVHHDLNTIEEYFEKVVFINKKILDYGKVSEVFTKDNIELTYMKNMNEENYE